MNRKYYSTLHVSLHYTTLTVTLLIIQAAYYSGNILYLCEFR